MSRVLGWGKGVSPNIEQTMILDNIMNAETVLFDRWKVMIQSSRSLRIHPVCKELFMYNYLSIGVDAQVTLDFHRARESPFYLFSNRMFNKASKNELFLIELSYFVCIFEKESFFTLHVILTVIVLGLWNPTDD